MQLDKTAVTISQRSGTDLIDLSLLVFQRYWTSIFCLAFLGTLPFATLNFILLWPLTQYDQLVMSSRELGDATAFQTRYLVIMTAAILIQAPLALSGVTYFIGQAVFGDKPTLGNVLTAIWAKLTAIILIQGFLRMSILVFIPLAFLFQSPAFRPEVEIPLYLLCLCSYVFWVRGFRPFALEILLLERCPLYVSKNDKSRIAYRKRSSWLHSGMAFELFGMHMGVTIVEILTTLSISLSTLFLIGVLTGIWTWGPWMDLLFFPFILWGIATWGTIIRFLTYMNSRIHTEGWEIELKLKAESQRLLEVAS
jgi:hypothetical protein